MDSAQPLNTKLSIQQLTLLSSIITCLREHISWHQDYTALGNTPLALPVPIINICANALAVPSNTIEYVWETLRDDLWKLEESDALDETSPLVWDGQLLNIFLTHGMKYKLGVLRNSYTTLHTTDVVQPILRSLQHPPSDMCLP